MTFSYPHVACLEDRITFSHLGPILINIQSEKQKPLQVFQTEGTLYKALYNSVEQPDGAKGRRWGNEELATTRSHHQPWLEERRKEAVLPDPGCCSPWTSQGPKTTPLTNPLLLLLQLLKANGGHSQLASWLLFCCFNCGWCWSCGHQPQSTRPKGH